MASAGPCPRSNGFDQLQGLRHRDAARGGRSHAADAVAAIGEAQRLALLDPVAGEIGKRDVALMVGRGGHRLDDGLRDGALVERVGTALGDGAQRCGELGVPQQVARGTGAARSGRRNSAAAGARSCPRRTSAAAMQPRRNAKTLLGKPDGRREQLRPGQPPVRLCRASSRRSVPGTPTLAPPKMASPNFMRAVVDQEPVGLGRRGRGLATVVALELLPGRIPVQHESAAADARRIAARPGSARVARRSAASAALPPARSICSPASTASGLAAEIMCDLAVTAAAGAQPQVVARSGCTSRSCERAPAVRPISATALRANLRKPVIEVMSGSTGGFGSKATVAVFHGCAKTRGREGYCLAVQAESRCGGKRTC